MNSCDGRLAYVLNDGRDTIIMLRHKSDAMKVAASVLRWFLHRRKLGTVETTDYIDAELMERILDDDVVHIRLHEKDVTSSESERGFTCWRSWEGSYSRAKDIIVQDSQASVTDWQERKASRYVPHPATVLETIFGIAFAGLLIAIALSIISGIGWVLYKFVSFIF